MTKLKTFIKWPGNKSKHLRHILPYIPDDYNTYIEPFIGSGALFLNLQPKKWIINDLNKDLIEAWKYVKEEPEKIIEFFNLFGKIFKPMNNDLRKIFCQELTDELNYLKKSFIRIVIYMLMKHCAYLGNILRDNEFIFYGLESQIYINNKLWFLEKKSLDNFINISDFLNNTKGKIYNKDYKYILSKAKENDFVFLDPPYIEEHDYGFQYNIDEKLDNKFLKELYNEVQKLDKKSVRWMMTQANTKEVRTIFKKYKIKKFKVYRMKKKGYVFELIIKNY
jgi:DNA adenine methylase